MKGLLTFNLDNEIKELLKTVDNKSALVNDLLKTYFGKQGTIGREREEILKRIAANQAEAARIAAEARILSDQLAAKEKEEAHLKDVFRAVPEQITDDFRVYPKMTPEILKNRFSNIYQRKYKVNWQDVLNAYNVYFNKVPLDEAAKKPE